MKKHANGPDAKDEKKKDAKMVPLAAHNQISSDTQGQKQTVTKETNDQGDEKQVDKDNMRRKAEAKRKA